MIGRVSLAYARRSLLRHPRRALLSVLGAGIGTSIGLFATAWIGGATEMQIRAASESGAGHVRVVPREWPELRESRLRLADPVRALAVVRELEGVTSVATRARASGLLAFGNRTAGVEVVAVDPRTEPAANRIVRKSRLEGRYLAAGDEGVVVIGRALAERLRVEVDDDLLVTVSGRDEMQSGMLRIVGILDSGSRDIDAMTCQVTIADIERLTGYQGPGEIAVMLDDHHRIEEVQRTLAERLGTSAAVVTWRAITPELASNIEGDNAFFRLLVSIIIVVVALGIASAQLTAVLERRRELGILTALGMRTRQVVALIFIEAVLVGLGGAVVALALGGSAAYWLSVHGVNLAELAGNLAIGSVLLDPIVYGDFGPWVVVYALVVSVTATVLAALYPARFATRTEPAQALRVA